MTTRLGTRLERLTAAIADPAADRRAQADRAWRARMWAERRAVLVQPDVRAGDLSLTECRVGDRHAEYGREVRAEIALTAPGSVAVNQSTSGFT